MCIKPLVLAESPVIEIEKGGAHFRIGEVPAYNMMQIQESFATLTPGGLKDAFKSLFGEDAKKAQGLFTLKDLRLIIQAVAERDSVPLVESSGELKEEKLPMGKPSSD